MVKDGEERTAVLQNLGGLKCKINVYVGLWNF